MSRTEPVVESTDSEISDPMLLWDSAPLLAPEVAASFDMETAGATEEPLVWTLDVPADPATARAELARMEITLMSYDVALAAASQRLDMLAASGYHDGIDSFSASEAAVELPMPESNLLDLLAQVDGQHVVAAVDFAGEGRLQWDEVAEAFEQFFERIRRFVSHFALIETKVDGQLMTRTAVNWLGNFQTTCSSAKESDLTLHERALRLALETRRVYLRIFTVTVTSAVKIGALLATPGATILALPAVWRFIEQVRSELGRLPTLT